MSDWRTIDRQSQLRVRQITSGGQNRGLYEGFIDSVNSEKQNGRLKFAGGEQTIPLTMPFEGSSSWIRSIPDSATKALLGYRSDTGTASFIRYLNDTPDSKLALYKQSLNAYRPLLPGEHEIHSSGYAQSYYSNRPLLEQRGGIIRSWLDQDKAEAGAKAPVHVRQMGEHKSNLIGDEERFGVVKRPIELTPANAAILAAQGADFSLTSFNYSEFPYPDFTLPGGVPAMFSTAAQAIATASEVASFATGMFKQRPYAKEYLRVINNPLAPLPPAKLIDIREGHVFADSKNPLISGVTTASGQGQILGENSTYLRAKYEYFTTLGDSTKLEIDDLGNVTWKLSLAATPQGWNTQVPFGGWKLQTGLDIDIKTFTNITTNSTLSTSLNSLMSMALDAKTTMELSSLLGTKISTNMDLETSSTMNTKLAATMNLEASAGMMLTLKGGIQGELNAPLLKIGSSPSDPMVLGQQLFTWFTELLNAFVTAAPTFIPLGNLGYPAPLNPAVLTAINKAIATMALWQSKTITVGP